jgi:uncharacterized membrane protein YfcA
MAVTIALVLSLVAATSFVSGVFGVAGGLILMGGLVFLLPVSQAMIVHGVAQVVSNASRVFFWRRHLEIAVLAKFTATSVACLLLFSLVRYVPSKTMVLFILGVSTVILFFVPDRWAPSIMQPGVAYLTGIAGTALMLMAGVSGPFLDQFFVRSGLDRRVTIATKAAMQCVSHLVKIAYFGGVASWGLDPEWWALAALAPVAAVAGASAATPVLARMTDKTFYWWTRRIVLVLGCYYIAAAMWSWLGGSGATG